MPASELLLNGLLDYGVANLIIDIGNFYVGLAISGSQISGGGYNHQIVTTWNTAAGGIKPATARVNFSPTGATNGGWAYNTIQLWTANSGDLLHSKTISPVQFIANGDTHQILVRLSGS